MLSTLALVVVAFLTLGFVTTAVFLACFWSRLRPRYFPSRLWHRLWLARCLRLMHGLWLGRCRLRDTYCRRSLRSNFALAIEDSFGVARRHALHMRRFAHFAPGFPFRAGRDRDWLRR